MSPFNGTYKERFESRIFRTKGCWFWQADKGHGRGYIYDDEKHRKPAPVASWEIHFGPVPEGMIVKQICNEKMCVNPEHLELALRGWGN